MYMKEVDPGPKNIMVDYYLCRMGGGVLCDLTHSSSSYNYIKDCFPASSGEVI